MNRFLNRRPLSGLLLPILLLASCEGPAMDALLPKANTTDTVVSSSELVVNTTAASTAPATFTGVFDPSTDADVSKNLGDIKAVNIDHTTFGCSQVVGSGVTISGSWTLHLDADPATTTHALGTVANASLDAAVRSGDGLALDRSAVSTADKNALEEAVLYGRKSHVSFTGTVSGPCQARLLVLVPAKLTVN